MNYDKEQFDKDAVGDDIIIGKYYGYTHNRNGFTNIVTGHAQKIGKKVTLKVVTFKQNLYNHAPENVKNCPKTVNIRALNLFPIVITS